MDNTIGNGNIEEKDIAEAVVDTVEAEESETQEAVEEVSAEEEKPAAPAKPLSPRDRFVNEALLKIKVGDNSMLDDLFTLLRYSLFSIACKYIYNYQQVEDAFMQLFAEIPGVAKNYHEGYNGFNLLCKKIKYICININRASEKYVYPGDDAIALMNDRIVGEDTEDFCDLDMAIEKLPQMERKIIYYRFYEQRTLKETAALMKINFVMVKRKQDLALMRLYDMLKEVY